MFNISFLQLLILLLLAFLLFGDFFKLKINLNKVKSFIENYKSNKKI